MTLGFLREHFDLFLGNLKTFIREIRVQGTLISLPEPLIFHLAAIHMLIRRVVNDQANDSRRCYKT
jgi:hypothetical protein